MAGAGAGLDEMAETGWPADGNSGVGRLGLVSPTGGKPPVRRGGSPAVAERGLLTARGLREPVAGRDVSASTAGESAEASWGGPPFEAVGRGREGVFGLRKHRTLTYDFPGYHNERRRPASGSD